MSMFDNIKDKATELAEKAKDMVTPEQADQAIDAVGDKVDDATGHKFEGQVDQAQDVAKEGVDKVLGEG